MLVSFFAEPFRIPFSSQKPIRTLVQEILNPLWLFHPKYEKRSDDSKVAMIYYGNLCFHSMHGMDHSNRKNLQAISIVFFLSQRSFFFASWLFAKGEAFRSTKPFLSLWEISIQREHWLYQLLLSKKLCHHRTIYETSISYTDHHSNALSTFLINNQRKAFSKYWLDFCPNLVNLPHPLMPRKAFGPCMTRSYCKSVPKEKQQKSFANLFKNLPFRRSS